MRRVYSSAFMALVFAGSLAAHAREPTRSFQREGQAASEQPEHLIIGGAVRRVLGSRAFTIEDRRAVDGELLVLAPSAEATPVAGATVVARGVFRRFDQEELEKIRGWNDIANGTREVFATQPVLLATSLTTAAGHSLMAGTSARHARLTVQRQPVVAPRPLTDMQLHAAGLAELIDEVGGRSVRLSKAHVLAVINPRALLIESASSLAPTIGNLDRVLVLIKDAALRVDAASLVGSNVRIAGIARTLLGVQVTGEVAWPAELTPAMVKRLEIRAAVLAESVHTADGVELTARPSPP